ncbi:glycoside hydrolase family 3 N-terminal domain-containing protein [Dictyobacter arantiisoli]|uniref:Beta-glucosidase n=1 Tax=Dictyobacter arantiisoli TaxID=2014874 RepID=A0A5A5T8D1_9CHLR|nr:glycoside hydrolase family 3 N-terminal domain-containing protein [Dictyobacter arantiisoli]GCF07525.1 beta-glucosidase [Dictyobacter arantiisoli]
MSTPLYKDAQAAIEDRVEDLLNQMTLEEKLAQLQCLWSIDFVRESVFDTEHTAELLRNGIGQITRIGAATSLHPHESVKFLNAIQRVAVEQTRLGIPVILHEESVGGLCQRDATVFPQGIALASTWDPELVKNIAGAIREQMLSIGARHTLAPVLDVARDPRWGRVEESYGEDPVLIGTMGVAYVQGLQTEDLRNGIATTGKHFLGYAMSEGGRNWAPVQLGLRELYDIYAEPFAAVIRDANIATIMNSYASVDGLPCAGSYAILTELLRDKLGFDGPVVADYSSVELLKTHHNVASTLGEAASLALQAGLDMELPATVCYGEPLRAEIEQGRVPLSVIDTSVRRVLKLKFQLGIFEHPYGNEEAVEHVFETPEQRALAREAVAKSTIVLTNDGILPLKANIKRLALIGPGADDERLLQGDYHYPSHAEITYLAPEKIKSEGELLMPTPTVASGNGSYFPGPYFTPHVTPLAGLRSALGNDVEISYAKGCEVLGTDRSGFAAAEQAASAADVAVVVVAGKSGLLRPVTVGEGNDATNLDLTGVQQELISAIAKTGTPLVVVVLSGRVHTLAQIAEQANALIQLFPAGEEGGNGLADILTGKVNPAGRLPVTLPRSVGQIPIYLGMRAGGDCAMFFDDYIDSPTTPLFPFGHGLSYTTFAYSNLGVQASNTTQPIEIAIEVRNSGERAGEEVVQLYGKDVVGSVARPIKSLLGFKRIALAAGESRTVTFTVHPSRLAFHDARMRFVTEPGDFTFSIGASSSDIRAEQTIQLSGEIAFYQQKEVVATRVTIA